MSKTKPNEPCPCGSGKKYKKCCFMKDGRVAGPTVVDPKPAAPVRPKSFEEIAEQYGSSPYAVARQVEEHFFGQLRPPAQRPVMLADIEGLSDETLLARLAELGVRFSQDEFRDAASAEHSAWKLSRRWRSHIPADRPRDHDFVALSVCSLWMRWCAASPSMEMVDDWMHEGYAILQEGKAVEAYEKWWRVWEVLRGWIRRDMRTFGQAEKAFQGTQVLFNWLQDFSTDWSNVVRASPATGERALTFLRECLERFPDEKTSIRRDLRCEIAQVHFALGQRDEGRAVVEALISETPRSCQPYAVLADELAYHPATPQEVAEAHQILLRAKRAKVSDARDYDLDRRLADVEALLRKPPGAKDGGSGDAEADGG